jgi:hypothetical protein
VGFGNIYYGLARRVFDMTVSASSPKTSLGVSRSMAHHPEVQHAIAQMALELEAIEPHLDRVAHDWSSGVDHGARWPAKIVAAKHHAVEASWRVVDMALDVSGGFGIYRKAGLERLFRDARLGRIHPANAFLTHEIVAKTALGISLDESPRAGRKRRPQAAHIAGRPRAPSRWLLSASGLAGAAGRTRRRWRAPRTGARRSPSPCSGGRRCRDHIARPSRSRRAGGGGRHGAHPGRDEVLDRGARAGRRRQA